ncbi:MAG: pyrroloquinoline quinone precursor peptide PqqA [Pseudolabrys sp.]
MGSRDWRVERWFLMVREEATMVWTTPTLIEICIGLEINGYLSPEF